jgi:uncharacterized protein YqgC (DUF456 family)
MDYILIVSGIIMILAGIAGAVLPVVPGPPLSYAGILLLHFTSRYQFSLPFLLIWGIVAVFVFILDQVIPVWGTKKFGGSKPGVLGSLIGLIAGMVFLGPPGIIIGPFAGAFIGELAGGKKARQALRASMGSFMGFLAGTILKLIYAGMMCWYFVEKLVYTHETG